MMSLRRLALVCLCVTACVNEDGIVEDLVTDYCQTVWQACGCEGPGVTQIACESMNERMGAEAQALAREAGLTFDKDCAERWLERVEPNCTPALESELTDCFPGVCSIYHGNVPLDGSCTRAGEWSDCAQGLVCGIIDTCEDPCAGRRRGDPCGGDAPIPCVGGLVCTADEVCGDAPGVGQPCAATCAPGARCDLEQRTCVAGGLVGDACTDDRDCSGGTRCSDGSCQPRRAEVCAIELPW